VFQNIEHSSHKKIEKQRDNGILENDRRFPFYPLMIKMNELCNLYFMTIFT